jgi:hypothetical protein
VIDKRENNLIYEAYLNEAIPSSYESEGVPRYPLPLHWGDETGPVDPEKQIHRVDDQIQGSRQMDGTTSGGWRDWIDKLDDNDRAMMGRAAQSDPAQGYPADVNQYIHEHLEPIAKWWYPKNFLRAYAIIKMGRWVPDDEIAEMTREQPRSKFDDPAPTFEDPNRQGTGERPIKLADMGKAQSLFPQQQPVPPS